MRHLPYDSLMTELICFNKTQHCVQDAVGEMEFLFPWLVWFFFCWRREGNSPTLHLIRSFCGVVVFFFPSSYGLSKSGVAVISCMYGGYFSSL